MNILKRPSKSEKGASLVEFALIAPFLFLLLFGIIEFAWIFAINIDVKQGAREGARLTAVAETTDDNLVLGAETCGRMDFAGNTATINWVADPTDFGDTSTLDVGDGVVVTVSVPVETLTGFIDWVFPSSLSSTVEIRIEQDPSAWTDGTYNCSNGAFS